MRRTTRVVVAAAVALAGVLGLGACAQIPMSGPVRVSTADQDPQADLALLPQGPTPGAEPNLIVQGFLGAAVAAPTSPKEYQTAREFLTEDAAGTWDPYASVRVVREPPMPDPFETGIDIEGVETLEVVVRATTIATLDTAGAYTEVADPRKVGYQFTLTKVGEEWRISGLDNGVLVPANLFANQFRATRLYFSAEGEDAKNLVPDLRWFPRNSWRPDAVEKLLSGPPEWLQGATRSLFPEGTQLVSPTIQEADGDEPVAVRFSEEISSATAAQRALIAAQISATLSEGAGRTVPVDLFNGTSRLAVDAADVKLPATKVQPMFLKDDQLYRIDDGRPVEYDLPVDLSTIDPTALAVSPATKPIVVRDGTDRIVTVSVDGGDSSDRVIEGPDLAAPSVDKFGNTWTSGGTNDLRVLPASGAEVTVDAEWLDGRKVVSVSVSPEGSRIAVVSHAPSGTQVQVAGIVRNENEVPVGLAPPLTVAGPVDGVEEARWSGLTTLSLLTRDGDGVSGVWTAGVGGQPGAGGQSRQLPGLTDVRQLAAGVTDQGLLVVTKDGDLEHEETGVWQPLIEDVDLVAYPG
ncbi:LpqB family beta-propeller domain-containing protein [Promicromonospora sp. NPDC023805]|uniref:LpqB family beta-propeller domain-containing protein n=1 Tax=Promicromonospora sp. NPDC023805 TaxID=3154696 RepID=UPI0033E476D0